MPLERQHTLAVLGLILGLLASMAIMAISVLHDVPISNSLPTLAGVCAGGLAGFLSQRHGDN